MDSKKLLFFFPENPFAKRGGNVTRAYNNLLILKDLNFEIDLVACTELIEGMNDTFEVDHNIISNFYPIRRRPVKKLGSYNFWKYKFIKFLSKKNNYNIFLTKFLQKNFNEILSKKKYDYIIINYEFWAPLIQNSNLKGAKTIVDTHDFITINEFQRNPKINIGKKLNAEIKNLNFFDKIIVISYEEYVFFRKILPKDKVVYIPQSFQREPLVEANFFDKKYDLLFVGSDNPFNIKSMQWFLQEVYPLLKPDISIAVVGRICKHLKSEKNINLLQEVDDISKIYNESKISICPMIDGTGMKVKVVEALSFGVPVVGTNNAVDGFPDKTNNGCIVTDSPQEFANAIEMLLNSEKKYKELQALGTDYFNEHFSFKSSREKWNMVFKFLN